jgi:hypothetical protein
VASGSTLGEAILSGGDTNGDVTVGFDNGELAGGLPGSLSNGGSVIATTTAVQGRGYIPGCVTPGYDTYDPNATYDDGSCTSLVIGSERDNPQGNTVSGPVDFAGFSNRGIVDGDATYYAYTLIGDISLAQGNYGTTTGAAVFDDGFSYQDGPNNHGYVGGGATFLWRADS